MTNTKQKAALLEALTNFQGAFRIWLMREIYDLNSAPRSTLTAQHKLTRSELRISVDRVDAEGPFFNVSYHSGAINVPRHKNVSLMALISTMRMMDGYSIERDISYTYFEEDGLDARVIVDKLYTKHKSIERLTNFQCVISYDINDIVEHLMQKNNDTKEFLVVQAGIRAGNVIESKRVKDADKSTLNRYDYALRQLLDGEIKVDNVATSTALAIQSLRSGVQWYELFDEKGAV